jgi:DNA-binding PadR family transcriptional regulator
MWPFRFMMHQKRGLRMLVLSMLSSSPKNGVEIMNEIEITTRGWWRPSPGSVYPVLDQLSKDGLIKKRDEDGKYELTSKGESQLEDWPPFGPRRARPQSVEDMLQEISSYVSYFEELSSSSDQSAKKKISEQSAKIKSLIDRMSKLT